MQVQFVLIMSFGTSFYGQYWVDVQEVLQAPPSAGHALGAGPGRPKPQLAVPA